MYDDNEIIDKNFRKINKNIKELGNINEKIDEIETKQN